MIYGHVTIVRVHFNQRFTSWTIHKWTYFPIKYDQPDRMTFTINFCKPLTPLSLRLYKSMCTHQTAFEKMEQQIVVHV